MKRNVMATFFVGTFLSTASLAMPQVRTPLAVPNTAAASPPGNHIIKFKGLMIDPTIKISDLLTVLSVTVAALALLNAWNKDRLLKKKESADKIRKAAGIVVAKLERWKELNLHFFNDVQPCFTDADAMLVTDGDIRAARSHVWREIVALRATASQRILDEQIEIAYADLYGYDPRIQGLFTATISRLKEVNFQVGNLFLEATQSDVFSIDAFTMRAHIEICRPSRDFDDAKRYFDAAKRLGSLIHRLPESSRGFNNSAKTYKSSELSNKLRATCERIRREAEKDLDTVIEPFREEMLKLISASDAEIVSRSVEIAPSSDALNRTIAVHIAELRACMCEEMHYEPFGIDAKVRRYKSALKKYKPNTLLLATPEESEEKHSSP